MIRRARADKTDKTFDAKSDTSKTVSGSRIDFTFQGLTQLYFRLKAVQREVPPIRISRTWIGEQSSVIFRVIHAFSNSVKGREQP